MYLFSLKVYPLKAGTTLPRVGTTCFWEQRQGTIIYRKCGKHFWRRTCSSWVKVPFPWCRQFSTTTTTTTRPLILFFTLPFGTSLSPVGQWYPMIWFSMPRRNWSVSWLFAHHRDGWTDDVFKLYAVSVKNLKTHSCGYQNPLWRFSQAMIRFHGMWIICNWRIDVKISDMNRWIQSLWLEVQRLSRFCACPALRNYWLAKWVKIIIVQEPNLSLNRTALALQYLNGR